MWTSEEMDALSIGIREASAEQESPVEVDTVLLDHIAADIEEYRDVWGKARGGDSLDDLLEPPDYLWDRLWSMGWLLYEASLHVVQTIRPAEDSAANERATAIAIKLSEFAQRLPWPHFAPRALGAIRGNALVASKQDSRQGFVEASDLHNEAQLRYEKFLDTHAEKGGRELFRLGLKEIQLQLVLSQTGTACRTAERVLGRWAEDLDDESSQRQTQDEGYWTENLFPKLLTGVELGKESLKIADEIEKTVGFTHKPTRSRLVLPTAFQNPGVMTARAALLVLALSHEVQANQPEPGDEYESWADLRRETIATFVRAYRAIEKPVYDANGDLIGLIPSLRRSLIQIRLNAALLLPGFDLPSGLNFAACLELNPLDAEAVQAMSHWLAVVEVTNDVADRRGDANVIGSATMPAFIRSVEQLRADRGVEHGYREWRRRWFILDRYAYDDRRRRTVNELLESATGP